RDFHVTGVQTCALPILLPAVASLVVAGIGGWMAFRYYEHTRLQATRRQLARLGIGELSSLLSDPDSARSARQDTEQVPGVATGQDRKSVVEGRGGEVGR